LFVASVFVYGLLWLLLPFIEILWIGKNDAEFAEIAELIIIAFFINTLSGAAYFSNLATGDVVNNTKAQFLIAIFNVVFSAIFSYFLIVNAVIYGYALSITVGSIWLLILFGISDGVKNKELDKKTS
jgi:O-antigen/teichoic acid export membrane protein